MERALDRKASNGALVSAIVAALICIFSAAGASAGTWVVSDDETLGMDTLYAADILLKDMTLREKIGQLILTTPEMLTGEARTTEFTDCSVLMRYPAGGVVLYGQNIDGEEQLAALMEEMKTAAAACGIKPLYFAALEEGGNYSRVSYKLGLPRTVPSPAQLGQRVNPDEANQAGAAVGKLLREHGFHLNLSPVALAAEDGNAEITERLYSTDAETAGIFLTAYLEGMMSEGVSGCACCFPGYASADALRPTEKRSVDELMRGAWLPMRRAIEAAVPFVTVSGIVLRSVDSVPSCLSKAVVTGILRQRMGYDGIVMAENMNARAVTEYYKPGEAAVMALSAGCDVLVLEKNMQDVFDAIEAAVTDGTMPYERIDESARRVLAWKIKQGIIR